MSTSTIAQHPAPMAAAAAAVVAIGLVGVAFSLGQHPGSTVGPAEPGHSVLAAPQHGGHYEYLSSGGKSVGTP